MSDLSSGNSTITKLFLIFFVVILLKLRTVEKQKVDRRLKNKISVAEPEPEMGRNRA